jgi:hypothetical protein
MTECYLKTALRQPQSFRHNPFKLLSGPTSSTVSTEVDHDR